MFIEIFFFTSVLLLIQNQSTTNIPDFLNALCMKCQFCYQSDFVQMEKNGLLVNSVYIR